MALTQNAPASTYRDKVGLGVWEHRGKVAAVGIGHSPVDRRWDERVETSVGAYSILAVRKALEDAGVSPEQVDGIVVSPQGLGENWSPRPIPEDFGKAYQPVPGGDPNDGLSSMSADWLLLNMPELKNVKFTMHGPGCMSKAICVAAQAVGDGLTHTTLVLTTRGNLEGRYGQAGGSALATVSGNAQWSAPWGPSGPFNMAYQYAQYLRKYGLSIDGMAPFVLNERRNGRMNPAGYYSQHPEEPLTLEDYVASRWIVKPVRLHDCDRPIQIATCYLFTTSERARDMKQKPVYILNHCSNSPRPRSTVHSLDEVETNAEKVARMMYEGSGLTPSDVDVFNMYEGYVTFHCFYLEAFQWHGVKKGESHDFFKGDISVEGPHPISSSGGNNGSGRTRTWMHTDSIQQLQGRAGQRQVRIKGGRPETAVSGGPQVNGGDYTVWGTSPD